MTLSYLPDLGLKILYHLVLHLPYGNHVTLFNNYVRFQAVISINFVPVWKLIRSVTHFK